MIVKSLGGSLPAEGLSGATVESSDNSGEVITRVPRGVGAFGEILAQETVGVLFVLRCHGLCGSQK